MNDQIMKELEDAAKILMAPPNVVTHQQRQAASNVFSNFRKTHSPYSICQYILDECKTDYVLFEAAGVLKEALIREWRMVRKADIEQLLKYLLLYVTEKKTTLTVYVRHKILQTIAVIIKRGSADDDGAQRAGLLNEIETLIWNGDLNKQVLGCSMILNIVQEYAMNSKSSDIGLTTKQNYDLKEQFELTDLKRVFQFCTKALSGLESVGITILEQMETVIKQVLILSEIILTWNFTISNRLFPTPNCETIQNPKLELPPVWKDVVLDNKVINLYYTVYWKIRSVPTLAHFGMTCLVQLASLQGSIFDSEQSRYTYLTIFIEGFIKLVESTKILDREAIGVSNIAREVMIFLPDLLPGLQPELLQCFLKHLTLLTCTFIEESSKEENVRELYMEAFDNMLECWLNALTIQTQDWKSFFRNAIIQIFNSYLSSHLTPPEGSRHYKKENELEEYNESEEPDRIKFKDQLQNIGEFARHYPDHSLPLLACLLEKRTRTLSYYIQRLGVDKTMSLNEADELFPIYEDLNWLLLIVGNVISYGTSEIPMDLMRYSVAQSSNTYLDTTLQVFGSPDIDIDEIPNGELCTDHAVRIMSAVFRLANVLKKFIEYKLVMFLSPEVVSSTLWFFKRWATAFLMFNEQINTELSMSFVCAFGRDSEGGVWALNFLLDYTIVLLNNLHMEPDVVQESVDLFIALVDNKEKGQYVLKSENLKVLMMMLPTLGFKIKREVVRGLTLAGVALEDPSPDNKYWEQILKPICDRLQSLMERNDFQTNYHSEVVKAEVLDVLDCLIGVAMGSHSSTIPIIFRYLSPVMIVMPKLMRIFHNYPEIVELIFLALVKCATHFVSYLPPSHCKKLYETSLLTIQEYSKLNDRRLTLNTTFEEDCFTDLLLIMELLSNLFVKDVFDFSQSDVDPEERPVVVADVCLFGLNLIMPLVKIDLLKFPELSLQYYKLISYICQFHPEKFLSLEEKMLTLVLKSIEFGLNSSGEEIVPFCCDFIQFLASHIYSLGESQTGADGQIIENNPILKPFLKLLLTMALTHQVNDSYLPKLSGALFPLMCCYKEEYSLLVVSAIANDQVDYPVKELLMKAFSKLTEQIPLKLTRQNQSRFRKNFEVFVVEIRGFFTG